MSTTKIIDFVGPLRQGVARIGRTGVKLHPVIERIYSYDERGEIKSLQFRCSCTGTNSGRAHRNASIFWGATNANCGTR